MDMHHWPYIKKSARRKKRLVKKDFDKQLIRLSKRRQQLSDQIRSLPPVILKQPYQKGWVRLFVLQRDTQQSDQAEFYQALLDKINIPCWHYDRSFKRRKIRKGNYIYFDPADQKLRELSFDEFHGRRFNLSDEEKVCFCHKEVWNIQYRKYEIMFTCAQTWRFELKIQPHIVYATERIDELLAQEMSEIENRVDNHNLQPRMWKLMGGSNRYWGDYQEPAKFNNELKNKPMYSSKDEYMDY